MAWSEWKKFGETPQKYPEILTESNYQNVSIKSPKMATLALIGGNNSSIVIVDKAIIYQSTSSEKAINMGFSYNATTDTLTLIDYSSGGRQFELYYI